MSDVKIIRFEWEGYKYCVRVVGKRIVEIYNATNQMELSPKIAKFKKFFRDGSVYVALYLNENLVKLVKFVGSADVVDIKQSTRSFRLLANNNAGNRFQPI